MLSTETVLNTRYRLQERLNSNSVRQTWLAEDLKFQDQVVVKLLALSGSMEWDDLKLLEREAQILQQLKHPRIARYRDYFAINSLNSWFGLVTEYVPGVSLKQKLEKRQRFTQSQLQWLASEVLEILTYLHQRTPPVLHRDLKPSNLVWGTDNQIYLIDFGCVQIQPRTPGATFTVVGTFGYTPIEQFGGEAVPASDLYALGATLVHLSTGIPPAELPQNNFIMQFREQSRCELEPQFCDWLERLISPTIDDRFQSAKQALIALNASVSSSIQSPEETGIRLSKSSDVLKIEIPSRFSIQYVRSVQRRLIHTVYHFGKQLQNLPRFVKIQIIGVIALAAFLLQISPLPLDKIGINLVHSIVFLPVFLLVIGLPIGLIFLILLLNSGIDYFERVSLIFDDKKFKIRWNSWGVPKQIQGELSEIQQINLTQIKDKKDKLHQSLEIALYKQIIFLFSRRKTYHFGQQLQEEELNWLKQEILDWVASHSTSKT